MYLNRLNKQIFTEDIFVSFNSKTKEALKEYNALCVFDYKKQQPNESYRKFRSKWIEDWKGIINENMFKVMKMKGWIANN